MKGLYKCYFLETGLIDVVTQTKNYGATKFKGRLTLNSDITIDYNDMFKLLHAIILDFNSITRH